MTQKHFSEIVLPALVLLFAAVPAQALTINSQGTAGAPISVTTAAPIQVLPAAAL